jgi:type IV pilus assembly protein PilN
MIRINLQSAAQRKQKRKSAPAPQQAGGGGGRSWSFGQTLPALVLLVPIVVGGAGSFYVHRALVAEIERVTSDTKAAEAELARLKPILDELERYKKDRELLEKKLAAIRNLEAARVGPVRVFAELAAVMPPQVWVTGVRESGLNAQIDGLGLDSQSVAVFANAMHHSPHFANVELTSVEQVTYLGLKIRKFSLTCRFQLTPPAPPPPTPPAPAPGRSAGAATSRSGAR